MERGTAEEALKIKEIIREYLAKHLEAVDEEIKLLKAQINGKSPLEEIKLKGEGTKWYAVFNGPFPGIYDDWYKAAPHCQKLPGIIHKSYSSKEEAEKALKEFEEMNKAKKNELYLGPRTFSETTKSNHVGNNSMKILGKIPMTLDNYQITSRKDHEIQVQFSEEKFQEHLGRLANWSEKEKINYFYLVDRKLFGLKAVITPGAPQILTFNMFQFGLIDCLYLSNNLEEIGLFPHGVKEAVQIFQRNIARERTIFLKFYSAYPDFTTKQQAKHFIIIGVSNNKFPLRDEPNGEIYNNEKLIMTTANQLASIFAQCQSLGKDSCIKILYKGLNILILSKTSGKPAKEKDLSYLASFELPFYALDTSSMNYNPAVLQQLCTSIKQSDNHACERCIEDKNFKENGEDAYEAIVED